MMLENFTLTDRLPNNNISQEINATLVFPCFMFTDNTALKILMVIGYSVLMTTSLTGNLILACVFFTNKTMKNNVNCYIMNMVLADLLLTIVYMPRMIGRILIGLEWLVEGTTGLILCKLVSLSQEISICVSILTVVIVAFERLFAVAFPLREIISKKLSLGLLCGTWIVSLAARSPMLYSVKTISFQSGKPGCFWIHSLSFSTKEARKFYHSFIIVTFFGLPLLCIMTLYTVILIILRRRQTLVGNVTRNGVLATNKKVTQMIIAVITAFILCWLLYFIVIPLQEFWNVPMTCEIHFLRIFLGHVNSACNPVICLLFSQNYRQGIKSIRFCRLGQRLPRRKIRKGSPRDRSVSNVALVRSLQTLALDPRLEEHIKGIYKEYDENRV